MTLHRGSCGLASPLDSAIARRLGMMCLQSDMGGVPGFTWQAVADPLEAAGRAHADGTAVFARSEGDCIERLDAGADAAKQLHDRSDHIAALLPPRAGSRP